MWGLVNMRMCMWCGRCSREIKQSHQQKEARRDSFWISLIGLGVPHIFAAAFDHAMYESSQLTKSTCCVWTYGCGFCSINNKRCPSPPYITWSLLLNHVKLYVDMSCLPIRREPSLLSMFFLMWNELVYVYVLMFHILVWMAPSCSVWPSSSVSRLCW